MGQDGMDFQHGGGGYVMSHAWAAKTVEQTISAPFVSVGEIHRRAPTGCFSGR